MILIQTKAKVSTELLKQLRELVWTYQSVGQVDADIAVDVCSLGQCLSAAR